jgi:hypothetical protein
MLLFGWFKFPVLPRISSRRRKLRRRSRTGSPLPACRPAAEIQVLEGRTLLSVTAGVSNGTLVVTDTSDRVATDSLTVAFDAAASQIIVSDFSNAETESVTAGAGCVQLDPQTVTCALGNITGGLQINLAGAGALGTNLTISSSDFNSVGRFANFGGSLSIASDGASGLDTVNFITSLTLASGKNLDVNLKPFAANDTDAISISPNVKLAVLGSGHATLATDGTIALAAGSSILTQDGDLTLEANQQGINGQNVLTTAGSAGVAVTNARLQATGAGNVVVKGAAAPTSGDGTGVAISAGGVIEATGGGSVTVTGTANPAAGNATGTAISSGGRIQSTTAGQLTVTGTGKPASGSGTGVLISGAGSAIAATGSGPATVTGTVGVENSGSTNSGVQISAGGTISGGTTAPLDVQGSCIGNIFSGSTNTGVDVTGPGSQIASSGADVRVSGAGGGTADFTGSGNTPIANYGVQVQEGALLTAGGTGALTVIGTGTQLPSTGSSNWINIGVLVSSVSSDLASITSNGGPVSVTGTGGGTAHASTNGGVVVRSNAQITAGASGTVTVAGTGGNTTDSASTNYGVLIDGAGNQALIGSTAGNLSVTGTAGGSGSSANYGVAVQAGGRILAASGAVSVDGTAGNTTGAPLANDGVLVTGLNSSIVSQSNSVSVTGAAPGSGTSANCGVAVEAGGLISGGGAGTTTSVAGTSGNSTALNDGVLVTDSSSAITSQGGSVSVTGTSGGSAGSSNCGVAVQAGGEISANANGAVSVTGTGLNFGVLVTGISPSIVSRIAANGGGAVSVTGTAASNFNAAVSVSLGQIAASGGSVTVTGCEGAVHLDAVDAISNTTGNITVVGDNFDFSPIEAVRTSGTATFRQFTDNGPIAIGQPHFSGEPWLAIDPASQIKAGTVIIGDANSGTVTLFKLPQIDVLTHVQIDSGSDIDLPVSSTFGSQNFGSLELRPGAGPSFAVRVTSGSGPAPGVFLGHGRVSIEGQLAIDVNDPHFQLISGIAPLEVNGSVDLSQTNLKLTASATPAATDSYPIIYAGSAAILNTFLGLPNGAIVTIDGVQKQIDYSGQSITGGVSNSTGVSADPLGAPPINLAAPDVVYNGGQYAASATMGGTATGATNWLGNHVQGATVPAGTTSLEGVGITYTYYSGSSASGTPIAPPKHVGTYTVVASFAGSASYESSSVQKTFHITPAPVTETIGNDAQVYGTPASLPADLPGSFTTAVNGETLAIGNYSSSGDTATAQVGGYAINGVVASGTGLTSDYTVTLNAGTLTVSPRPLTLTANSATKTYGQTLTFSGTEFTTSGLVNGDSVASATLSSSGAAATAAVAGSPYAIAISAATGNGLGNYNVSYAGGALTVNKADAAFAVTPYSVTYDGTVHTAIGTATGVLGESLTGLDLSGTTHTHGGTFSDEWVFTDSSGNYNNTSGAVTDTISQADASITVNGYSGTYDGHAHGATGSAMGLSGENLSGLFNFGASFTNVPGGTANWSFAGNADYKAANGLVAIVINKADALLAVTPYSVTYDDSAHTATGSATGVLGESLTGLDLSGTTHTQAGTYSDSWTFTDAAGNYNDASGTVTDTIEPGVLTDTTPITTQNVTQRTSTGNVVLATFTDPSFSVFTTLDDPSAGPGGTSPLAIDGNNVVGGYYDANFLEHGFLYNGGTFTTIDDPLAVRGTELEGISGNNIIGVWFDAFNQVHGFLYNGSTYTELDFPGATSTFVTGVSGSNVVGTADGHAFLYDGSTYFRVDPPGSVHSYATGISGNNVVGRYTDGSNPGYHGFTYNGSTYTTLDPLGSYSTLVEGVSGSTVVGEYYDRRSASSHGFLYDGSTITTFDFGSSYTIARGASGSNIVGQYSDKSSQSQGFLYDGSTLTTIDGPFSNNTIPWAVSGSSVVGFYINSTTHGFLYAPQVAQASDFTPTVDWNGPVVGTPTVTVQLVSQSNGYSTWEVVGNATYAAAGNFTPTVAVNDADGESMQTASTTFNVVSDAVTATATPVTTAVFDTTFTGEVATFVDANPLATLADFPLANVKIDWGDGKTSQATGITQPDGPGTAFHVFGSHTYGAAGATATPFSVTITAVDGAVSNATSYSPTVARANATVVVTPYSVTYDGSAHTATYTITGVGDDTSAAGTSITLDTTHTDAGTYAGDTWSFSGGPNYNDIDATAITDVIGQASANIAVSGYSGTFDGHVHGAIGSATGVNGEDLSGLLNLGSSFTNAPGGAANWSFAGNNDYKAASGSAAIVINKADAVLAVTPYSVTYDGKSHAATGTATGVLGEALAGLDVTGTTHTHGGTYTDNWTFTDATGNYKDASGTVIDTIGQADASITVNGYTGTYDGQAHVATGSATGVQGENLGGLFNLGASFTNAPGGTANWSFAGNADYKAAGGTVAIVINKANAVLAVTPYSVTYDAKSHTATGTATGVLGEALTGLDLTGTTHTHAGTYSDGWTFTDATGNYNNAGGAVTDTIGKANASIAVNGYAGVYDGHAHGATGSATGVPGENLGGLFNFGASFTNVPGGTANWSFAGNSDYKAVSGSVTIVINKVGTTTTLSSSLGTSDFSQAVTFTAVVTSSSAGNPTGRVDFYDGGTLIGSGNLTGVSGHSQATFSTSSLAGGLIHSITAVYAGDGNDQASTSAALSQTVLSPQQQTTNLTSQVNSLVSSGALNSGNGNALTSTLNDAVVKLTGGNKTAGVNQLNAFINKVQAFQKSGKISASLADALIAAANQAIVSATA